MRLVNSYDGSTWFAQDEKGFIHAFSRNKSNVIRSIKNKDKDSMHEASTYSNNVFESEDSFALYLQNRYGNALLSKVQAANELSVSRATIDNMRLSGEIKSTIVGSQVRISVKEIARIVMS